VNRGNTFTTAELYSRVLAVLGCPAERYTLASLRYDLAKLRAKGLVAKLPNSRRYQLLPLEAAMEFTLAFDRLYFHWADVPIMQKPFKEIKFDEISLDPHAVASALGGAVSGCNVIAPGPGHSHTDRSLSIKIDSAAPDGFIVHSFAGDSPLVCREYVRATLGLRIQKTGGNQHLWRRTAAPDDNAAERLALALRHWNEAHDPLGTVVVTHLTSRGLTLPDDVAGDVLRFHPALKYNGVFVGAMVALIRDVRTNEPCGIHRTFLDSAGRKLDRRMLGRARHAAIKVDADENVALGLIIGEGLETCLAARLAGFQPVWALGSAGAISAFPVVSGIEAITILGEVGDGGANRRAAEACATRWIEAGREAYIVAPLVGGDLNDVWCEAVQ
jgi:putative DNA primase/helicase